MSKKALIAMSGGVDSGVAAYLCKKQGYDCTGVTMRLYNADQERLSDKSCCSEDDVNDARCVANKLSIPHHVFNFSDDFKTQVIERFVSAYEAGATPNPCIDCNRYIKFERLIKRMHELELDYVVTGHYARIEYENGRYLLKKGLDKTKDQSYVLYSLTQEQLSHTLLPLGGYNKAEIREIAEQNGFSNAHKQDSQDICFVPDGDYAGFIERYTGNSYPDGEFINRDGRVLGTHKGIIRYTIGQRRGLGLALPAPMYVLKKDMENNRVILCSDSELYSSELDACDFNWIAFDTPPKSLRAFAKVRYKQEEKPATVTVRDDATVHIVFDQPQRAIAKGQAVVLYDGDTVLGGGTIL